MKRKKKKGDAIHPNTKLLSIPQGALVLGVSETSLRRMCAQRQLPSVTVRAGPERRMIRVSKQAIDEWISKHERKK